MSNKPVEWFGYLIENLPQTYVAEARSAAERQICPFLAAFYGNSDAKTSCCRKKTRLLDTAFGVCTAQVSGQGFLALCPYRFLEDRRVFRDIALDYFKTLDNLIVYSEVTLPGASPIGRFDYVIVKHERVSNRVLDFVFVEFQAAQTTSTGALVQAVRDMRRGQMENTYAFGINWADIWKRSLVQLLLKGAAAQQWGKVVYWVVQRQIFDNLAQRYGLQPSSTSYDGPVRFLLYDLYQKPDAPRLRLQRPEKRVISFTLDAFYRGLQHLPKLPSLEEIERHLGRLLKQKPKLHTISKMH